jgi:hypothetical protein
MTNNSILLATNALAGYALASDKAFATLPVTGYIVGAAMTTVPYAGRTRQSAGR